MNGDTILWSYEAAGDDEKIPPIKRAQLNTAEYVSFIEKLNNDAKVVTASKKGFIDVHDLGSADVSGLLQIAYGIPITGISTHPTSPDLWASCSDDRRCVVWDKTKFLSRQASALLQNYEFKLTAVYWSKQEENKELLMVGDEIGNVLTLDLRTPNRILQKTRVSNRSISQINFNSTNQFGIVSNNSVSTWEVDPNGELNVIDKQIPPVVLYDMCWDEVDKKTFYVVGEKQFAEKVTIA